MAWTKDEEERRRQAIVYGPDYRAAKRQLIATHGKRCMRCGSTDRVQCDHKVPASQGGDNSISNLELLCISCHGAKTARQSRAWGGNSTTQTDPPAQPTTRW